MPLPSATPSPSTMLRITSIPRSHSPRSRTPAPAIRISQPSRPAEHWTFLLYAKPTTVQTYEMYVGTGLTDTTGLVSAVQVNKNTTPFTATTITWPANWTQNYNATTGLLTVTMSLAGMDFSAPSALCQPANFCTGTANSCSCALKTTDPTYTPSIFAQCQAACSTWAVKDLDCPDAGCYGFSVTLPSSFSN